MLTVWAYSLLSIAVVSLVSLVGVFTLSIKEKTLKKILLYFVSFSAGALFGDAFLHLLPELVSETGFTVHISLYILVGILFSLIIETFIHWRHCHIPESKEHVHPFAIMNLLGDAVHNFIDGLIIGASYVISIPVGLATTLAVVFHEIPQEIGDFAVLLHGGFSKSRALFFNFLVSLASFFGVVVSLLLVNSISGITSFLVPFAVGNFIYIAGSDLIPELHRAESETKKAILQLVFFVLGIAFMYSLLLFG